MEWLIHSQTSVEFGEWISYFVLHFTGHVITYSCRAVECDYFAVPKRSSGWTSPPIATEGNYDFPLRWRHNGLESVSNHQPHDCLLNRSKLRVTGLCVGNSPVTGEFPAQMASNAENVSIWWRHHAHIESPLQIVWYIRTKSIYAWFLCMHLPYIWIIPVLISVLNQ